MLNPVCSRHVLSSMGKFDGLSQFCGSHVATGPDASQSPLLQGQSSVPCMGLRLVGFPPSLSSPTTPVITGAIPSSYYQCPERGSTFSLLRQMRPKMGGDFRRHLVYRLRAAGPKPGYVCTSMTRNFLCLSFFSRSFLPFQTCP